MKMFRAIFMPALDEVGGDESLQQSLRSEQEFDIVVAGRVALTAKQSIKLPEHVPLMILRDPPGGLSTACGGGGQTRHRSIVTHPFYDGKACAKLDDMRACNTQECTPSPTDFPTRFPTPAPTIRRFDQPCKYGTRVPLRLV